jgi:hypothetical protein
MDVNSAAEEAADKSVVEDSNRSASTKNLINKYEYKNKK